MCASLVSAQPKSVSFVPPYHRRSSGIHCIARAFFLYSKGHKLQTALENLQILLILILSLYSKGVILLKREILKSYLPLSVRISFL